MVDFGDSIRGTGLVVAKVMIGLDDGVVVVGGLHFYGKGEIKNQSDDNDCECFFHVLVSNNKCIFKWIFHHYHIL